MPKETVSDLEFPIHELRQMAQLSARTVQEVLAKSGEDSGANMAIFAASYVAGMAADLERRFQAALTGHALDSPLS